MVSVSLKKINKKKEKMIWNPVRTCRNQMYARIPMDIIIVFFDCRSVFYFKRK